MNTKMAFNQYTGLPGKEELKSSHGFAGKKDSGFFRHLTDHLLRQADAVDAFNGTEEDKEILYTRATIAARHAERAARIGT